MPVPGRVEDTSQLKSGWVTFDSGGDSVRAYSSAPAWDGTRAGVIVVHEAFGVTEHAQDITRRLANIGYAAICPDLYTRIGEPNGDDMQDVFRKMFSLTDAGIQQDLEAAAAYLRAQPGASGKVGCIGFCAGGRTTLLMACQSDTLDAAVDCWGGFIHSADGEQDTTPDRPNRPLDVAPKLRCPLLAVFGAEDENPTVEHARQLEAALVASPHPARVKIFEGAGHAFLNDTRAIRYRDAQAHELWSDVETFFKQHLG